MIYPYGEAIDLNVFNALQLKNQYGIHDVYIMYIFFACLLVVILIGSAYISKNLLDSNFLIRHLRCRQARISVLSICYNGH